MYLLFSAVVYCSIADADPQQSTTISITGFDITGVNPVVDRDYSDVLDRYLGEGVTIDGLQDAAKALEQAIHTEGYTFVRVVLPRQPLDDGTIELRVVPFVVDRVTISGNDHFGDTTIRSSLPGLVEGETPNTKHLSRSLAVAREHPTRQQKVTFAAAEEAGRIDARIEVEDSDPSSVFTWLNNTGSEETGDYRLGIGYQDSDLFDRDHSATLSYTTSPTEAEDVAQFGGVYQAPLYDHGGILTGFVAESDIDSGRVAEFFDVAGQGSVLGLQYTQFFPRDKGYAPSVVVSVVDKLFDNDIDFDGEPVGVDVRSRPLSIRYSGDFIDEEFEADFYIEYADNLSGGSANTAQAYQATRQGANPGWNLIRYGAGLQRPLPRQWSLTARLDGQYADEPLIAGEQIGIGGAYSVRGFEEREVSGDKGIQMRLEAWSPAVGEGSARGVLFLDAGRTRLVDAIPGDIVSESVASLGGGFNWSWRGRLNARVDAAYVLDGTDGDRVGGTRDGDARIHFNVAYRVR